MHQVLGTGVFLIYPDDAREEARAVVFTFYAVVTLASAAMVAPSTAPSQFNPSPPPLLRLLFLIFAAAKITINATTAWPRRARPVPARLQSRCPIHEHRDFRHFVTVTRTVTSVTVSESPAL